jgi:hypothetical protein
VTRSATSTARSECLPLLHASPPPHVVHGAAGYDMLPLSEATKLFVPSLFWVLNPRFEVCATRTCIDLLGGMVGS